MRPTHIPTGMSGHVSDGPAGQAITSSARIVGARFHALGSMRESKPAERGLCCWVPLLLAARYAPFGTIPIATPSPSLRFAAAGRDKMPQGRHRPGGRIAHPLTDASRAIWTGTHTVPSEADTCRKFVVPLLRAAGRFDAHLGGWSYTFDAHNNLPRVRRVLLARSRDAADVAIATTFGPNVLNTFLVRADEIAVA